MFQFSDFYSLIGLKTLWNYGGLFQLQYHPGLLQHTFKRSPAHRILSIMLWLFLFGWVTLLAVPLNLRNAWFLPRFPHLTPQEFIGYDFFKLNVRRCRRKLLLWLKTCVYNLKSLPIRQRFWKLSPVFLTTSWLAVSAYLRSPHQAASALCLRNDGKWEAINPWVFHDGTSLTHIGVISYKGYSISGWPNKRGI